MPDQIRIRNDKTISFSEAVEGSNSSVKITHDGLIHATDLVRVMTDKNRKEAARVLRDLKEDVFSPTKFIHRSPAAGGHAKKYVSFSDALELVMVLPGTTATKTRVQFQKIILRYFTGDQTLHAEINANSTSMSPITQLARMSANTPQATEKTTGIKRSREDIVYEPEDMEFIKQAFAYQKEALELRNDQDNETYALEAEGRAVYNNLFLGAMETDNENLRHEEKKALDQIKQMEIELDEYDAEFEKDNLRKAEHIQAIKIFTGMCTQKDCFAPYCTLHPRFSGFTWHQFASL